MADVGDHMIEELSNRRPKINTEPKLAYRVDEACRALGIGRTSLYALIAEKKLRTARVAGRRVIPATELERLLAEALQ